MSEQRRYVRATHQERREWAEWNARVRAEGLRLRQERADRAAHGTVPTAIAPTSPAIPVALAPNDDELTW